MAARGLNVFVQIGAKLLPSLNTAAGGAERRLAQMGRKFKLISAEMKADFRGVQRGMDRFATNVSLPAAGLVTMGGRAVYEWSKVGNELQAVTQMSMSARKEIEAVARAMPGNPAENLSAALDLARSGFNAQQIRGTLGVTLKLGRADNSVDKAGAADILTNVMKGMKLPDGSLAEVTASANRVANNIAIGGAQSSSDTRLMGESFKYAAPLAARLGVEMETMTAYFMTMADAGIKGSESGVALRSGMVRLLKPTKSAMAVLAKFNMSLNDYVTSNKKLTAGQFVNGLKAQGFDVAGQSGEIGRLLADKNIGGADLVLKLTEAVASGIEGGADAVDRDKIADAVTGALTSGGTKMDFTKFLQDVTAKGWAVGDIVRFFDVRQGARLETLTGAELAKNMRKVQALMRVMNGQGSFLDKMYAMQMQGAVGPWERMKQSFGNLFIAMAESGTMETIANGIDKIAAGVMWLSKSSPSLLKWATYGLMAVAVMAPLGFMLAGVAATFGAIKLGARLAARILSPFIGLFTRLGNVLLSVFRTGAARALIGGFIRVLVAGFALLSNPFGWGVILAGVAAALVYYFRDDIARAWPVVLAWFSGAWDKVKATGASVLNWGAGIVSGLIAGMKANWGRLTGWFSARWAALKPSWMGGGTAAPANPPGRANGGSVTGGNPYTVGEEGPELFVPGRSGTIVPAATTAALLEALRNRAAAGGNTFVVNVHGASDPQATAIAVRHELERISARQSFALSD